jgi:threonine dehydrogenase-like Zn-dependent dehydrogenase
VKAAYYQARRELSVREAPDPEPGPGEVLVRVAACGALELAGSGDAIKVQIQPR